MSPPRKYTEEERRQRAVAASSRWKRENRERFNEAARRRRKAQRIPCPFCDGLMKHTAKLCIKCKRGENNPLWKGGRWKDTYGYVHVIGRPGEAGLTKNNYIMEHRRVMQDALGRPLLKWETVHHKNGKRDDNRLENLELWASRQPQGQRVQDLVQWAREILAQYEGEGW